MAIHSPNLTLSASLLFSFLLLLFSVSEAIVDDLKCLDGVKNSLQDPQQSFAQWSFTNTSAAAICRLPGVSCWNDNEIRLFGLQLSDWNLAAGLPKSLQKCHSLQKLDLSRNKLSGSIPPPICTYLPYLVYLDLSRNDFTGAVPPELANCKFLNYLILSDNRLSGTIPYDIGQLDRLKSFSVANNDLSGTIPTMLSKFNASGFDGNDGLCGKPLESICGGGGGLSSKSLGIIIAAGVFGAAGSLVSAFAFWWWFFARYSHKKRGYGLGSGNDLDNDHGWVQVLKAHKLVQVSLFQKPPVKVKLADLMAATNDFNPSNAVISTSTGVSCRVINPPNRPKSK